MALLAVAAVGCAPLRTDPGPSPSDRVDQALAALADGDLRLAQRYAEAVPEGDTTEAGRQALLVRAMVALDPRSPSRSPGQGAELAARYAAAAPNEADAALGRFLYALALDLGAKPPATSAAAAEAMPQLAGPSLAGRLVELERAVARLRSELARIQETLKP